ncbi:MAG: ANTAR domain-containing protein [Firmicutes bacterium]|nr:ANTAR domain-containing protein [Bacillota bacterium]
MSLKQKLYSVLIVSSAEKLNASLVTLLPGSSYAPVHIVTDIGSAKRRVAEFSYDFVIINSPLPDDSGIRFSIDTCVSKGTVVLLLVKNDIHEGVHDRVAEHGVFTLPKPVSRSSMTQALEWMESARERLRHFEKKTLSIEQKMEEIRLVNRAKWLLITELKLSEPDAHRFIEKQAMDLCISKRSVAEDIIKTYA